MNIIQALILGLVQGATEFIPVSSSAHLTLLPWLLNWNFDPLFKNAFDVMVHWGTLLAVLAVLWRDLWALFTGWLRTLGLGVGHPSGALSSGFWARVAADADGRMAWLIAIASLPAALAGLLFEDFFEMLFGTPRLVSILLLVTAALLALSERRFLSPRCSTSGPDNPGRDNPAPTGGRDDPGRDDPGRDNPAPTSGRELSSLTWLDALWIGVGQALAIAPGVSRSGATIAAGLVCGVRRDAAARFSFLLGTPVILAAGVWQLKDLFVGSEWTASLGALLAGFVAAALSGYLCIRFLLSYLRRGKLYPFALYCALAGTFCLIWSFVR